MKWIIQFSQKVKVLLGIVGSTIVSSFFLERIVKTENNLYLLQHCIITSLTEFYPNGQNPNIQQMR